MPKSTKKRSQAGTINSAIAAKNNSPYYNINNNVRDNNNNNNNRTTNNSGNLITPNTTLGQHFLKNPAVISAIIAKANVKSTDTVLEIGPGTGNMTIPLLQQAKNVIALEYDTRMVREVLKRVEQTPHAHKLKVIHGDAIKTSWPYFDLLIANLPYHISSQVIFKLLVHRPMFRCAVLMFQEEFALRLTARPGETLYCRLSVNTQLLAKIDQLIKVGKHNFRPPPKVESRVVRIELKNPPPPVNFIEWDGMIRLLFNRKNKTLRSVLMTKSVLKLLDDNRKTIQSLKVSNSNNNNNMEEEEEEKQEEDKSISVVLEEILEKESWKGKRASKLDLDDFLQLLTEFNEAGIHFS